MAPRFDLATEALMARLDERGSVAEQRTVVLPQASADDLCHLVLAEGVQAVICGGIEEEYYQYLTWKKVEVYDSVIGLWSEALKLMASGGLEPGSILINREETNPCPKD